MIVTVISNRYKYFFVLILLFYCLVLTQFGFENFDTGYIPSFSWRIINGQTIYYDFIYKGPPVTLYFHAIFMYFLPETGQFFVIRIINYCLFALQVYLLVDAYYSLYDFKKSKINKWGLICIGFVISLLNFSPYPWPSTDGLLFATVAFWLLSKSKNPTFFRLFAVALFSVFSALTKQSFYLIPLLFLLWVYIKNDFKKATFFFAQLLFFLAIYFSIVLSTTSFTNFIQQTTGETHLQDLFYVGIHNYLFVPLVWFLTILLVGTLCGFAYLKHYKLPPIVILPFFKWASIAVFLIAIGFCLFKEVEIASRIALDATLIALVYRLAFQIKNCSKYFPVIVTLGIAWSSSISLGYQYPILFATGIVLSFIILLKEDLSLNPKYYFWVAFPICLIAASYNFKPYREAIIFNLMYSLESVSPKLKYIKTNKENFEKLSELKKLVTKYGENFIVAPNLSIANYLFNDQSELPADWIIETEIARSQKMFIRLAADKKNYIFLEKSFLQNEEFMPEKREKFSSITEFIYQHFNCIEETQYFVIYNALKKNETVP